MQSYFSKLRTSTKGKDKEHDAAPASAPPDPAATTTAEEAPKSPVLDEEDEKFLERLASLSGDPNAPPPVTGDRATVILDNGEKVQGRNAQEALMDGADKVPLPLSPPELPERRTDNEAKENEKAKQERQKSLASYFAQIQTKFTKPKDKDDTKEKEKHDKDKKKDKKQSNKDKGLAASSLEAAVTASKSKQAAETAKEENDLSVILDQLNLSAVNNRVFSFSKESQELLDKFKLVLKDIVNGVPTAYNDLEKLLTDSETQLKGMYNNLPPFLQSLVKTLPAKMGASLGLVPELLAAQGEKPGFDGKMKQAAEGGGTTGEKKKSKRASIPSLKSLISAQGAVATMLRSILNFLKFRFPAFVSGTNVLMSLAVFILLFVFWYCHKRGRETRLESEAAAAAAASGADLETADASSASSLSSSIILDKGPASQTADSKPEPPLIIHDNKEVGDKPSAVVSDMPDVLHLPDPKTSGGEAELSKPPV